MHDYAPPWIAVDSVFGPVPKCRRCEFPLTRAKEGSSKPAQKKCPECGAILDFSEGE